jgi:hypothetical protein
MHLWHEANVQRRTPNVQRLMQASELNIGRWTLSVGRLRLIFPPPFASARA